MQPFSTSSELFLVTYIWQTRSEVDWADLANFRKIYSEQPTKMAEGRTPGRDRMLVYKRKQ